MYLTGVETGVEWELDALTFADAKDTEGRNEA
jgi:hypothetical protein